MLTDNILYLREHYPDIRNYFREMEDELRTDRLTMLESKKGIKTIQYETDDSKKLMIHSKYDPEREANRIISAHKEEITDQAHVFFYGIGLGYHIKQFQKLFPENSYSVYEPLPEVFLTMSEHVHFGTLFSNKKQNLYIDTHDRESINFLEEFNTSNRKIHIIILPSYENIIQGKVARFNKKVKNIIQQRRTSLATNINFQKRWVMNSLINFKEVLSTPNILRDIDQKQFEGKPAIIVAAGPSLAKDMKYLGYIKENNLAHLFSVGSAINSLLEYDILPDVVCTYDPGEKNQFVFKKMVENKIDDIPMLFGSSVGHETLKKYNGPKVHFLTTQDRSSLYFLKDQLNLENDFIIDSPSIAVMTLQVLQKLDASPIIFAGQNLGYLHDRRYSKGIEYDFINSNITQSELDKAEKTVDVYGNEIKTNKGFNNMRTAIENFVKSNPGQHINTTKGGAAIEGVPFQDIEEVIEEVLIKPIHKENWWDNQNQYNRDKIEYQLNEVYKSKERFNVMLKTSDGLLKSISTALKLKNKRNLELALSEFDTLYNSIMDNIYYKHFLSFYIRVHVIFLDNEIKRLNNERDIFVKGNEIIPAFNKFVIQCKQNGTELERIMSSSLNNH